jgi:UDP-glucose 4-epimerase
MTRPIAMVTGGGGFIGRHVGQALVNEGYDAVAVGRSTEHPLMTSETLAPLFDRLSLVVFCAGGSSVGQSIDAPLADFEKSVPPLAAVLELMRTRAPSARLVFLSSAAVYGHADHVPTSEDAAPHPISPYGVHKRISEELCSSWARNYGLRAAVVRLFSVYGPGLRKQLLWDACRKARAGERRFAGTGREVRDWLHVDDAAALILAAAAAASPDVPIVNGGTGVPTTVAAVVGDIFAALGAGMPEFVGGGRPGDPATYLADISRASSLGWRPRIDVQRGVHEYVRWFAEQE